MDLRTVIWTITSQDPMNRLVVDMIDLRQVPEDLVHREWECLEQEEQVHLEWILEGVSALQEWITGVPD